MNSSATSPAPSSPSEATERSHRAERSLRVPATRPDKKRAIPSRIRSPVASHAAVDTFFPIENTGGIFWLVFGGPGDGCGPLGWSVLGQCSYGSKKRALMAWPRRRLCLPPLGRSVCFPLPPFRPKAGHLTRTFNRSARQAQKHATGPPFPRVIWMYTRWASSGQGIRVLGHNWALQMNKNG